jgi:molybdate transport system permease protein
MNPVVLSLLVSALSACLVVSLAFWLGFGLQRGLLGWHWRWILQLPLSLPPLACGLLLLWAFSPLWPWGSWLSRLGLNPIFTIYGAILASSLVSFPLALQACESAWREFPEESAWEARGLGALPQQVWRDVAWPRIRPGLMRAWVLSFQRCLGEFGATLLVAGNIPGQTQTLPLALFSAAESGHSEQAAGLLFWTLALAFLSQMLLANERKSTHASHSSC